MAMRRRMRWMLSGLQGGKRARLRPARQWVLSVVLLVLFGGLGWTSLPADLAAARTALRLEDKQPTGAGVVTPVFVLREDGAAARFGDAAMETSGIVRVGLYDPLDPLLAQASTAVSLPGDGRLLWLLASPEDRQTLRDKATALVLAVSASAVDIVRSPPFTADYRDQFLQILGNAVHAAWQTSRDSGAWEDLLRSYQPILRAAVSRDVRPIVERHLQGIVLRMLTVNTLTMINPFRDRAWNTEPIEQAVQDAIEEIRSRDIPEQTAKRLLDAPQTIEFLRVFVGVASDRLAHDRALQDLIAQMVYDPRFRPFMQPAVDAMLDIGWAAPRLLTSPRGSTDLNLVAAASVRTMLAGRPDRVVVFMSPRRRDELMTLDAGVVHTLLRLQRDGS